MKQTLKISTFTLFFLLTVITITTTKTALAINNPAAEYCVLLGFEFKIQRDSSDNERGTCLLPDNSEADAWDFYRGKTGQSFSYCAGHGYGTATRTTMNQAGYRTESAICVKPAGQEGQDVQLNMLDLMRQHGDYADTKSPVRSPRALSVPQSEYLKEQTTSLPVSFDWRNINGQSYIGPIRNQGNCGACYAFGAAAAAEGAYNVFHNRYNANCVDFSESFIAWCLGTYGPYSEHFQGCDGADYDYAELGALTKEGVTREQYFPYTGVDPGSCKHQNDPVDRFAKWGRIAPNDINGIKNALMTYGVLDVAVQADGDFSFYSGGIYNDSLTSCPDGAYTKTNHAVALVGWGHDSTHGDYWLLRNSWGPAWGENGYMKINTTAARVGCSTTYLEYSGTTPTPLPKISVPPIIEPLLLKNERQ